jgi:hypothetical protein
VWWQSIDLKSFEQRVLSVRGLEVHSEVVAVTPRRQDDGAQYLAIRVRSSRANSHIENMISCYLPPTMTRDQLMKAVQQSSERFADEFAQEQLGIAPPKPTYWLVAVSNPNDTSKRVQGLGVCDPNVPLTLVSQDFCSALGLKVVNGQCHALLRVLGKRFLANVTASDIPILAVIGNDLVRQAISEDTDRNALLESFFLDPAARAYVARGQSLAKTVLVIGSYSEEGIKRLRSIEGFLFSMGYDPVLIADYPSGQESLEAKMLSFATISRFVVYESTFASGGIDELAICKQNDLVTAVLHEEGRMATSMQKHYGLEHTFITFFPYQQSNFSDSVRGAAEWAETVLSKRETFYKPST